MSRTLLLIEPRALGWGGADWARRSAELAGAESLVLGARGGCWARAVGIRNFTCVAPALGRPELATSAIRRAVRRGGGVGAIHAWSIGALRGAAMAEPGVERTVFLLDPPGDGDRTGGLRKLLPRAMVRPRAHAVFSCEPVGAVWRDSGLVEFLSERVESPPCERSRAASLDKEAARRRWGLREEFSVGLLAQPEGCAAARRLAFIVGLLGVAGRRVAAVCHPDHRGVERMRRFFERLTHPPRLVLDASPAWEIASGIDAAVWLSSRRPRGVRGEPCGGPWAARWALAAGTPLVAERCATWQGELCDATLVPPGDLNVARALLDIADRARPSA